MNPLIGITTYGTDDRHRFHLPVDYVHATRRAGGVPLLLPPGERDIGALHAAVDAVIFAGGGDLDPATYGAAPHETLYLVDKQRDAMEIAVARRCVDDGIPTLAICRGLQVVNVALGGTLHTHLPEVYGDHVKHRLPPREPTPHRVTADADSLLARTLQRTAFDSASWHHQAVDQIPPSLHAVAHAPDGVVEAMEITDHPWFIAVQWHPELTAESDPVQQRLFDAVVDAARRVRSR